MSDPIHPDHYQWHPSGVEAIEITEHFGFCLGNSIKYIWRAGRKGDALEDLKKARYYIDREISRIEWLARNAEAAERLGSAEKDSPARPTPEEITAVEWFGNRHGGEYAAALRTLLEKLT
jgi:hypothetical protein